MEYGITFTQTEWTLVLASLVAAGFAILAGLIYTLTTRGEVTAKYRSASDAGACLLIVAFLAYVVLTVFWTVGYHHVGSFYHPSPTHRFDNGFRYLDWAVTVPLLMIELTSVLAVSGPKRQRLRAVVIPSSFLMIATGFLGTDTFSNHDTEHGTLLIWGAISTVFFLIVFGAIYPAIISSRKEMSNDARTSLTNVASLLALTWGVYPIAYMFPVFFGTNSADAATTRQLLFSATDVVAKVGYGVLIHKIAKQRSAEDVRAGTDTHPEPIYLSGELIAEARPAVAVALSTLLAGPAGAAGYAESPAGERLRRAKSPTAPDA